MKMCDVFISYRRSDGEVVAKALCNYLREGGLRVFLDTSEELGIEIGSAFPEQLKQAIEMAAHYVLIASPDAVKERAGEDWVFEEINTAYDLFKNSNGKTTDRSFSILKTDENVVLPKKLEELHFLCVGETEDKKSEAFKAVFDLATKVNRKNLWYAAQRWLEKATGKCGRFESLNISETIMPNVNNKGINVSLPINVSAKDTENSSQESLLEVLKKAESNIMLVGEGGAGKTTALVHIMKKAYEDKYTNDSQIPIFVDLSYAPDTYGELYNSDRPSFIRRSIYRQLCQGRLDEVNKSELDYIDRIFSKIPEDMINSITSLLTDKKEDKEPEYLLLLDGLNEVSTTEFEGLRNSARQMVLKEIVYLIKDCPNVRLVITSRSQTNDLENTQEFTLCGVNDDAIIQYLEEVSANEKIDHVINNEQLKEVLKNPLFLTLYASGDVADDVLSAGEILHSFFTFRQQKLNADIEYNMGRESGNNQNRFTGEMKNFILDFIIPEIAWTMEKENKFKLYEDEFEDIIKKFFAKNGEAEILGKFAKQIFVYSGKNASKIADEFVEIYREIDSITSAILDCCVNALGVLQFERPSYSFIHQHIRDFFAAQKNINELRLAAYLASERGKFNEALNSLVEFNKEPVNIDVRRFMGEALGEHRNKPYLSDGIWYYNVPKENCDRNLIKRAFSAYRKKFDGECGYGIYSLITILKETRKDLSGEDFSNLDMKYCNFNGIVLGRPGLSARFNGALVSDDTFLSVGHSREIFCMEISPDETILATCDKSGIVSLWDLKTFSLIKRFNITESGDGITDIVQFGFIESGKILTTAINYVANDEAFYDAIKTLTQPVSSEEFDKILKTKKLIKTKTIHISIDTLEHTEFPYLNIGAASSASTNKYKASKEQYYGSLKEINLDECKNLSDFKNLLTDDAYFNICQEFLSPDNKFSLWNFSEDIALYEVSTGKLINCYHNNGIGIADIDVFFIETGILVNFQFGKTILFDFNLEILQEKEDSADGAIALSKNYFIFNDFQEGTIAIATTDTLDILGTIKNGCSQIFSTYLCQNNNIIFYHTTEDKAFVYDSDKNQVLDFVEAVYDEEKLLFRGLCSDYGNLELPTEYRDFSKKSPTELKAVIGYDYLRQNKQPFYHPNRKSIWESEDLNTLVYTDGPWYEYNKVGAESLKTLDYSEGLWLLLYRRKFVSGSLESTEFLDITKILLCNENNEILATIEDHSYHTPRAIFLNNNEKVVLLNNMGLALSYIDTKDLIDKKNVEADELNPIKNFSADSGPILGVPGIPSPTLCAAGEDNNVVVTSNNNISFWNIEKEVCYKRIEHTGGLYVIDVELNNLHPKSELSEDTKQKLKQYGAIVKEDK